VSAPAGYATENRSINRFFRQAVSTWRAMHRAQAERTEDRPKAQPEANGPTMAVPVGFSDDDLVDQDPGRTGRCRSCREVLGLRTSRPAAALAIPMTNGSACCLRLRRRRHHLRRGTIMTRLVSCRDQVDRQ
jgi:hypothetical protein